MIPKKVAKARSCNLRQITYLYHVPKLPPFNIGKHFYKSSFLVDHIVRKYPNVSFLLTLIKIHFSIKNSIHYHSRLNQQTELPTLILLINKRAAP